MDYSLVDTIGLVMGKLSNAEVTAILAEQNLDTLAKLDGGISPRPEGMVAFISKIGKRESHFVNRQLDSPDNSGYIM